MSIDHVAMYVPHEKLEEEIKFMEAAFAHIGFKEFKRPVPCVVGLGTFYPWYWLCSAKSDGSPLNEADVQNGFVHHVAVRLESRAQVDEFHKAAVAAGGKDNGAPGIRAHYHPQYHAAFVISPSGINVEAVNHGN